MNTHPIGNETKERLRGLRPHLEQRIRGQPQVLDRLFPALVRGELGLTSPNRPRGSFLFVGPTGVGKTELTNVFTAYLTGEKPVRFDMSEYQNQSSVEKLIGGSPGESGLLGKALSRAVRGTLLFDEIEKAHPLLLDLFLQILEDGRITLATGKVLDLRPFYVVLTSNIGAADAMRMHSAPFASVERTVLARVSQQLRPELVGRVTEKLVFRGLPFAVQREICEHMLSGEISRLESLGFQLEVSEEIIEHALRHGFHKTHGARPMRTTVEQFVQSAVADALLDGAQGSGRLTVHPSGSRLEVADRNTS